ncbi:MAG: YafY family transcriptional regulator [Desulfovibrio sp.]|uniref:helix-turn-helix transcriptional regulator n=1 Tax=Desulfovibrio sp. TaxID=885 RepID=UPI00135E84B6|nr:YafY family protein [Desulfovibrio sp.]MTJ93548.1 YafY family transcriptional regulator [Desulfovibrio sp.]
MQIERLFKILFLLLNGTCATSKELAERCSVSVRTIQRDIDTLSLAGIPVHSSRGYRGGVNLPREFTLDKTFITEREQADVLNGLQALHGAGYPDVNESFQKLAAVFRKKAEDRWLRVDFSSWHDSGFGKEKFNRLKEAILEKRVIEFTYYNSENQVSQRIAEPLCMLFRERAWYIWAFDRGRQEECAVRASRMRNLVVKNESFTRVMQSNPMDTPDYAKAYEFQRVVLRITGNYAFRIFDEFPELDIHQQPDGSFIVDQPMPVNEWLMGYLLSFADGLDVLEPQSLRRMMREKISLMLQKYDRQLSDS